MLMEVRDMNENKYYGWLEEDSLHSVRRAKQRAGLNKKKALRMMELAKTRGITSEECSWSKDRKFLENRSNEDSIAVAYNGYCFILDRPTMNCITMFKLPRCFGKKKTYYKENKRQHNYCFEIEYAYA